MNELQEALALGNLHFSLAVCAQMIRCGFGHMYTLLHRLRGVFVHTHIRGASTRPGFPTELFPLCTYRLHDRSSSGHVDMQDFRALHKFLEEMNQSFQMHDQDRSGSLDSNETHAALTQAGLSLSLAPCQFTSC